MQFTYPTAEAIVFLMQLQCNQQEWTSERVNEHCPGRQIFVCRHYRLFTCTRCIQLETTTPWTVSSIDDDGDGGVNAALLISLVCLLGFVYANGNRRVNSVVGNWNSFPVVLWSSKILLHRRVTFQSISFSNNFPFDTMTGLLKRHCEHSANTSRLKWSIIWDTLLS